MTPEPKEAIHVFIEISKEEFITLKMPEKWKELRADAVGFLKKVVEELVPLDHIIEHAKKPIGVTGTLTGKWQTPPSS